MENRPSLDDLFKNPPKTDDNDDAVKAFTKALRGPKGESGEKGEKGEKGDIGTQGVRGRIGIMGEKGNDGIEGKKGAKGDKGEQGERGFPGEDGRHGKDGQDGKDAKEIKAIVLNAKEIVEKINKGQVKIRKEKISGLDDLENKAESTKRQLQNYISIGGTRQTRISANGVLFSTGATTLDFVGATVSTPAGNDGSTTRITITGGGGGNAPIVPSGTVNGSNLNFTASSTPTIVFTEGGTFTNGFGVTISGLSITFAAGLAPQQWVYYI